VQGSGVLWPTVSVRFTASGIAADSSLSTFFSPFLYC
jgi:hypothetical protein